MAEHEDVIAAAAEMSQTCGEQLGQVEEEDWSSFMCSDGTAFGRHEEIILNVSDGRMNAKSCSDGYSNEGRRQQISIQCVSALSPLDMIDMYNGSQDATGNRIWTGALLFLEVFARTLPMEQYAPCVADDDRSKDELPSSTSTKNDCFATLIQTKLSELRTRAFNNKAIIELGCGTGISGICLLVTDVDTPSTVTFTDFDKPALDLCKRNCESNIDDRSKYNIQQLEWGSSLPEGIEPASFDTVIATDVLYDISSLAPLMHAASQLVKVDGYFILSHVPRASVEAGYDGTESTAVASADILEALIVAEAGKLGLCVEIILRPSELSSIWEGKSLNKTSFAAMDSVGSAVLVFRKQCD